MSNLLNHPYGEQALIAAVRDQLLHRMKRWFERNTNIAFYDWVANGKIAGLGGTLSLTTILGELNVAHDQEILDLFQAYNSLARDSSGLAADFYVDSVNGDDVTGNGTADTPFANIFRVQEILPYEINSNINIFVSAPAGNPILFMHDMNHRFGPAGQLTIQGTDAQVIEDGPLTVNAWTQVGVGMAYAYTCQSVAPGWVVGEHKGRWVHCLTGANAGRYYCIVDNSADTLYLIHTVYPMAPGDTYEIVSPGTNIFLPFQYFRANLDAPQTDQNARFIMTNLNFWADIPEFCGDQGCDLWFALVNFVDFSFTGNTINVNHYAPLDDAQIVDPFLRDYTISAYSEIAENYAKSLEVHYCVIDDIYNMYASHMRLAYSGIMNYYSRDCSTGHIEQSFCYQTGGNAIDLMDNEILTITGLFVQAATNGINIEKGDVRAEFYEGVVANIAQYSVQLGPYSSFSFDGTPVSGTVGDVWSIPTAGALVFPAVAGTGVSDLIGSWVIKVT